MGDYADCVNLSDPRFDPSMIADNIKDIKGYLSAIAQHQADDVIELFKPIKHKIIGLGVGNHELAILKRYHYDMMMRVCGMLNVRYLGWSSLTRIRLLRTQGGDHSPCKVLTIFAEHSYTSGRKKGGKVNAIEDKSNEFEADIYLRGHSHDKLATTKVLLYLPKTGELKLGVKKRVYAICPSFFNTYVEGAVTYGEIAGYAPTSTGVVKIDVEVNNKDELDYHIFQ